MTSASPSSMFPLSSPSPLFQESQQQAFREPYGLNLAEFPAEQDLLIYNRFAQLGESHQRRAAKGEHLHLANIICLEPVSRFPDDSEYAVSPPQVDGGSQDVFESHVMAARGQVRPLRREDILMYREYVRNRYM